jgi:hypothetical protein
MQPEQPAVAADPYAGLAEVPCYGVLLVEGVETGDTPRRQFEPGSVTWAALPLSFKWQEYEGEGHGGACVVGRIENIWRDGALIRWTGAMDNVGLKGREAIRLRAGNFLRGVSIMADDTDQEDVEIIYPAPDLLDVPEAAVELAAEDDEEGYDEGDADSLPVEDDAEVVEDEFHMKGKHNQKDHAGGSSKGQRDYDRARAADKAAKAARRKRSSVSGAITADGMLGMEPEKVVLHAARIRSATLLPEPAFVEASMELGMSPFVPPPVAEAGEEPLVVEETLADVMDQADAIDSRYTSTAVVAGGYTITIPDIWPEAWFDEPTQAPPFGALHITDQGRVFGYLAPANVSHRGFRASGMAVMAPRGIDYSEFQNKPVIVAGADGGVYRIPAGSVTFDCGHASPVDERRADPAWAAQHYENSCSIAARVRVGENKHGTWVAGALLHGITADSVERMMACALSGDWQGGKLKGALLVPVEGFPRAATASVRVREDAIVASSVPIRFDVPAAVAEPAYVSDLFDLIASATGRDDVSRWAEIEASAGEVT